MGEIADMMIDGTLCSWCGEYIGDNGYPAICGGWAKGRHNPELLAKYHVQRTLDHVMNCKKCQEDPFKD